MVKWSAHGYGQYTVIQYERILLFVDLRVQRCLGVPVKCSDGNWPVLELHVVVSEIM